MSKADWKKRENKQGGGSTLSRPVAGAAGDLLPGLLVDLVSILLDRKLFAARRAAKYYVPSTDAKLDFLLANLALHENLKRRCRMQDT
ncbi:MAG TPA: hypothetical protein VLN91_04955 [Nitrospirota bacterium]|nr:hypothetical protein [Nitrospirota bacterium]